MNEKWKIIKEYPNYKISNLGKVYSIKTKKILKYIIDKDGYCTVGLYNNKKQKRVKVHRLVCSYFISNNETHQVNHIDGNKLNNSYSNLEWVTSKENISHSWRTKLNKSKLDKDKVNQIRKLLKENNLTQKEIAALFNVDARTISNIKLYKIWKWVI